MSKVVKMKAPVEKYNGTERQTLRYLLKDVWFYYLNTSPRPGKGKSIDKKFPGKDCNYSVSIWQKTVTNSLKSLLSLRRTQKVGIKLLLKQLMQMTSKRSLAANHHLKQTLTTS